MINVIYYDTTTGEIFRVSDWEDDATPTDYNAELISGESSLVGTADIETDYISGGVVTSRPSVITDDQTEFDITNDGTIQVDFILPTGSVVTGPDGVESAASTASEHFQFKTVRLGEFIYQIDPPFPYLPCNITVRANAV